MTELKILSRNAVPSALEMAVRYRLLNEPEGAESICLDILAVDPGNQDAMITMLLALTDKFTYALHPSFSKATEIVLKFTDDYFRSYFTGIIFERRAKAHLKQGVPGSGIITHDWLTKAMEAYGQAIKFADPENQEAMLRWNSCARILDQHPEVKPGAPEVGEMFIDSFDTPH